MVETAKANGADVYYYLKYLLTKTPTNLISDEELEKLCPWDPECKDALEQLHHADQKAIFDAM
ncbi:transposase domain-containing protein [Butyrivibrio sp. FC2001]|uniref:transposase domain-containing protein n=1 Tax=Butyrivibrio sp. FC2001 TaxID=1280671 RepID=UPI001FA73735